MLALRTPLCSLLLLCGFSAPSALAQGQRFRLNSVSVQAGQTWALNREIVFDFNEALDFSTVNPNTLQLTDSSGLPAVGSFVLRNPDELVFEPRCPSSSDLSDSGLAPGETYTLNVPDATSVTVVLLAASGKRLAQGALLQFLTPPANSPLGTLFDDGASGPPSILVQPTDADGSHLDTGAGDTQFFQLGGGGFATLPGYLTPLNLQSDPASSIRVAVNFNQSLLPFESNINSDRMRLEFEDLGGAWHALATDVELVQNCSSGGATVQLTTSGVLPQARNMRVWIDAGLQDIVGDPTLLAADFLRFESGAFLDGGGTPIDHGDERLESFDLDATQDSDALLDYPRANWSGGFLSASNGFAGTGGPGGNFDLHVGPGTVLIIDTVQSVVVGGPNGVPTTTQTVVNGVLDIRNLVVPATSVLIFRGPNPATILASGTVTIDGLVSVDGFNGKSVFTLNTPTQPESGAAGNCGGGDGGIGSWETTAVTPRGGPGEGAFGVPTGGGEGGEAGYSDNTQANGTLRRAAGGGGGRFGHDQEILWQQSELCEEQSSIGLDAESGFPGADQALSSQGNHIPYGGHAGDSPFQATGSLRDDFYGRAVLNFEGANAQRVRGELSQAWAGAGGGAGGDATRTHNGVYPPPTLINTDQDKGAGGGGGAGALTILALGDVVFGPLGSLTAIGGYGNGGENTAGVNRVGGGSGGGSGGHLIVHTAGTLDLSQTAPGHFALDASGGQGGQGANGAGGAFVGQTTANLDAKHLGANNGVDNPWEFVTQACLNYMQSLDSAPTTFVVRAAGGDGGPGVVQLHVGHLAGPSASHDIAYPGSGQQQDLRDAVRPVPVGYNPFRARWVDHLLPDVSARSQAQSTWIALGNPQVAPGTSVPDLVEFLLAGTDPATGLVLETTGVVDLLPALLAPSNPVEANGLPNIVDAHTIYFDAAGLSALYASNPSLLRGAQLLLGVGAPRSVEAAEILPHGNVQVLSLTVSGASLPASGLAAVHPRHFSVWDGPFAEQFASGSSVRIEFQAAGADANGERDPLAVYPALETWATDPAVLTGHASNADLRYVRFRVTFEMSAVGPVVKFPGTGGVPGLGFLKLPIRF